MHNRIIPQKVRNTPLKKGSRLPDLYDPWQRLLAAIALQAVVDIIKPEKTLTLTERRTARDFIAGCRVLYQELGIPLQKLVLLEKETPHD